MRPWSFSFSLAEMRGHPLTGQPLPPSLRAFFSRSWRTSLHFHLVQDSSCDAYVAISAVAFNLGRRPSSSSTVMCPALTQRCSNRTYAAPLSGEGSHVRAAAAVTLPWHTCEGRTRRAVSSCRTHSAASSVVHWMHGVHRGVCALCVALLSSLSLAASLRYSLVSSELLCFARLATTSSLGCGRRTGCRCCDAKSEPSKPRRMPFPARPRSWAAAGGSSPAVLLVLLACSASWSSSTVI